MQFQNPFHNLSFVGLRNYEASHFFTQKGNQFGCEEVVILQVCKHEVLGQVMVRLRPTEGTSQSPDVESRSYKRTHFEVERFRNVNHKNIVQFYGVTMWPGFAGIITESPECGCLLSLLRSKDLVPVIPWWLRHRILTEVFEALQYLHNRPVPIVHGDVTSRAILLTDDLIVKLSDIHAIREATANPSMADDILRHSLLTPDYQKRVDVYSASQVGYEIITRKILSKSEFGYITSLHEPVAMLAELQLEDELGSNNTDSSVRNLLKKITFICGNLNNTDGADANTVLGLLTSRQEDYYTTKLFNEAREIGKWITLRPVQSFAEKKTLDVIYNKSSGDNQATDKTSARIQTDSRRKPVMSPPSPFFVRPANEHIPGTSVIPPTGPYDSRFVPKDGTRRNAFVPKENEVSPSTGPKLFTLFERATSDGNKENQPMTPLNAWRENHLFHKARSADEMPSHRNFVNSPTSAGFNW
ncbi:unnamed protein product [Clavelina lepadiformis]|uniref:Protein kinase domain-containing protein n=1 Tax=Clavelina lepadiformis TaxID=159417 RepID=A0ABP0GVQ5_CLALP